MPVGGHFPVTRISSVPDPTLSAAAVVADTIVRTIELG
jgi:hypothetical protein